MSSIKREEKIEKRRKRERKREIEGENERGKRSIKFIEEKGQRVARKKRNSLRKWPNMIRK